MANKQVIQCHLKDGYVTVSQHNVLLRSDMEHLVGLHCHLHTCTMDDLIHDALKLYFGGGEDHRDARYTMSKTNKQVPR